MTRAYIRVDPALSDRKASYPDGAYAAFVDVLCLAEFQPARGRFRSEIYTKALLGRRGRWVKFLVEHGDLLPLPDGRLYVEGWDEWQEGDWKVGERVRRIRGRDHSSNGHTRPDVTPRTVADVTPPNVTHGWHAPSDGRRTASTSTPSDSSGLSAGGSAGSGAGAGGRPRRPAVASDPAKEHDEAVARARSRLADPAASSDVKAAARFALQQLGEPEQPGWFEASA